MTTEYQPGSGDEADRSSGKNSDEPLTYTGTQGTAGAASGELIAAAASTVFTRTITISVPANAAVDANGFACTINFGAAAVAATNYRLAPGKDYTIVTLQQVRVIRNGASDVTLDLLIGTKS